MKNTLTILTLLVGTSFLVSAEVNATSFNDYMKQANKYAKDAAAVASKEVVKAATPAAKQLAQKALQEAEKVVIYKVAEDIFCKIIRGEINADFVYRDEEFIVIKDINPQAPIHLLVVPIKHVDSLEDFMEGSESCLLGRALLIAHKTAQQEGMAEKGYRFIIN